MAESESIRTVVKEHRSHSKKADRFNHKVTTFERIFVISNFILELPSAVFDQLSSANKAQYALFSMLISFTVLIVSITDLFYKGRKERATWMKRGLIPWFYYPYPNSKPFGTFSDIFGLLCAIFQFMFATIAYAFLSKNADNPIKVSVWPIIFAFGVLYSRLLGKPGPLVRRLRRAEEFTLAELAAASNNFSQQNKVGDGSFGFVYKGKLSDGRQVAIKRVGKAQGRNKSEEEQSAFESELTFLSRLHHKHLVRLFGYCEEHDERILVYEYLNNGDLYEFLHGKWKNSGVIDSWKMRIKIALEAARGIEYLHNYAVPPVVHRNIKSSNILLDSNWTASVADFGFSMAGLEFEHSYKSMKATGTDGNPDLEYYNKNELTAKSDIYSLGVVFLELLTGKKPKFQCDDTGGLPTSIVDFVVPKILASELVNILDHRVGPPQLGNEAEAVEILAYTALHCANAEESNRPNIKNIVSNLEQASSLCDETMENFQQRRSAGQWHIKSDQIESRMSINEIEQHQL